MIAKMWEEIAEQPAVLEKRLQNSGEIRELVKALKAADVHFVYIAARGTSDHAAVYGKYIIEYLLGIPVALAAASIFTIYHRTLSFKNSLVIGISQSGAAADVLEVIQCANRHGALTVSITNAPDSPLAQAAKFHLDCKAGVEASVAATKTFTSQMFVLAQLATQWAQQKQVQLELEKVPGLVATTLELSRELPMRVERYLLMQECFMLARGINYAVALEAALKIQETNYIRAQAFATSDFQHGPIAMIDREIPAMVFAPEGPAFADLLQMVQVLRQNKVELIVISNNQALLKEVPCSFAIPATTEELITPFFNVVVAQMFACQLALVKQLDPDHPRRLNKITITL